MLILLPFTYVFLCLLCAMALSKTYATGFWWIFALSVLITPFVTFVISVFLPKHSKAYCMNSYDTFIVGNCYAYKLLNKKGKRTVLLFHNGTLELSLSTFNNHFSVVINDEKKRSSSRFKGVI